jgi:hypothetical protein|tara:strand:+ start:1280 stop:1498 length:219 start_codon:yes stop_codon:yes gene_type:complete
MTLRNINLNLELGQTILVGQNNDRAKITKIEFHEKSGEVSINTTRGPRNVLTFRLCEEDEKERYENAADKYR